MGLSASEPITLLLVSSVCPSENMKSCALPEINKTSPFTVVDYLLEHRDCIAPPSNQKQPAST